MWYKELHKIVVAVFVLRWVMLLMCECVRACLHVCVSEWECSTRRLASKRCPRTSSGLVFCIHCCHSNNSQQIISSSPGLATAGLFETLPTVNKGGATALHTQTWGSAVVDCVGVFQSTHKASINMNCLFSDRGLAFWLLSTFSPCWQQGRIGGLKIDVMSTSLSQTAFRLLLVRSQVDWWKTLSPMRSIASVCEVLCGINIDKATSRKEKPILCCNGTA